MWYVVAVTCGFLVSPCMVGGDGKTHPTKAECAAAKYDVGAVYGVPYQLIEHKGKTESGSYVRIECIESNLNVMKDGASYREFLRASWRNFGPNKR